ncbi:MAG: dTDP-4-dehydrorhamnose reductase [Candidatus Omnitrophota bacterium]
MRILITGSSGMLGTEFCKVFGEEHELIGIDVNKPQEPDFAPPIFHEASITYAGRIRAIFDARNPEVVIHAAAWTDVDGCEEKPDKACLVNTSGTKILGRLAKSKNIPFIFISTDFVFDGEKDTPYEEEDPGNPLSVYGKTKWEAEEFIRQELDNYMILRTSWLYGKNGKNFVDTIIGKARKERHLKVVNDQVGGPTYAKDVAKILKGFVSSFGFSWKDIFHTCNAGKCTWFDFARQILADLKDLDDVVVEPITAAELGRPAPRPRFSVLDNSKLNKKMGYIMRPWEDALKDYIDNECPSVTR